MVLEVLGYGQKPPSKQEMLKLALEILEEQIEDKREKGWNPNPMTMRFVSDDITRMTLFPNGLVEIEILGGGIIKKHLSQFNLAETYELYNYVRKKLTGRGMFYGKPAHPELAKIVEISSVQNAKKSVKKLLEMAQSSGADKRVAIKRAMILAANRARAFLNNPNISAREKGEMRDVAEVYEDGARRIIIRR